MMKTSENLVGRRIMFVGSDDPYTRLSYGTEGMVTSVDCTGTVHVKWDDGSSLGMIAEAGDRFVIL